MTSLYQRTKETVESRRTIRETEPTNVTFRVTLPHPTNPSTVHVLGSWDNYRTAHALEQDSRVGSGVWKGMISEKVGLQMGNEYEYYYLLDSKRCIPDPCIAPEFTTVDSRGRVVSLLYVPRQLQGLASAKQSTVSLSNTNQSATEAASKAMKHKPTPTSENAGTSLPSQLENYIDGLFGTEGSQSGNSSAAGSSKGRNSLKGMFRGKGRSKAEEEGEAKRKWSLPRSFLRRRIGSGDGDSDWLTATADSDKATLVEAKETGNSKQEDHSPTSDHGDLASYLRRRSTSVDITATQQPARPHYYSPVMERLHTPVHTSLQPTSLARNVSGASQPSMVSAVTSPSLTHTAESYYSPTDSYFHISREPEPKSAFSPDSTTPNSSDCDVDEAFEVGTPPDGLGINRQEDASKQHYEFPRYYNFDELHSAQPGGNRDIGMYAGDVILSEAGNGPNGPIKPLGCLREEIAGEMAWREEMVEELGYLGSVVL